MTQHRASRGTKGKRLFRTLFLTLMLLFSFALGLFSLTGHASAASSHRGHAQKDAPLPVGVVWKLTVSFIAGSRQGQSEISIMTFLPSGTLTATFPGASPSDPPVLPPAIDGTWYMTASDAFHYQLRDPIREGNHMVAYIQVQVDAHLVSPTAFVAGGIGIGYAANANSLHQYNITSTIAVAV